MAELLDVLPPCITTVTIAGMGTGGTLAEAVEKLSERCAEIESVALTRLALTGAVPPSIRRP